MSEAQLLKQQCLTMAAAELEQLLLIIGELGYVGYKISLCKIKGLSYTQCSRKFNISKSLAQFYWEKCQTKGYDIKLKNIFKLP
jgi:hypothetical protein